VKIIHQTTSFLRTVCFGLIYLLSCHVHAGSFPAHPINLVVGYAPGGPTDILARQLATELGKTLGENILVINKAGASANIAAAYVASAKPDGYTLLFGDLTLATNPSLMRDMPLNPLKDFKAVASVGVAPLVLVVNPAVPANTLPELIAYAHANPDKLNNGTAGYGNLTHLAGEVLKRDESIKIQQIPYNGSGPMLTDLIGGQVSMGITGLSSTLGNIKDGRVRALAITGPRRSSLLPDVPTFSEALGKPMPELSLGSWWGVFASADTPDDIIQKLNTAINAALHSPGLDERLASTMNIEIDTGTPKYMDDRLKSESSTWAKVIRQAGIQAK